MKGVGPSATYCHVGAVQVSDARSASGAGAAPPASANEGGLWNVLRGVTAVDIQCIKYLVCVRIKSKDHSEALSTISNVGRRIS